jgi:hypothetical protein
VSGFRRSGIFGLVGVVVVAALVAAIALTMGSGQANPKPALALIFGVIALFMFIFFVLQARDVSRAAGETASVTPPKGEIADPTTLSEPDLWVALATGPITSEAIEARNAQWDTVRSSIRLGWLITPLIFAAVVPMYLFGTFIPILVGAPLIGLIALSKSFSLLRSGGELDSGYDRVGIAMRPLGLDLVERPTVWFKPRLDRPLFSPDFIGAVVMAGERYGRQVSVCFPGGEFHTPSAVTLAGPLPEFDIRFKRGRLRADPGGPGGLGHALGSLPASKRWKGVKVEGGPDGLIVYRGSSGEGDWLRDLWLAERIAGAVAPAPV